MSPPDQPVSPGGIGGRSAPPSKIGNARPVGSEVRLLGRAVRNGWVSHQRAERILAEMERICCDDPAASHRAKVSAALVVMRAAAIDALRERTEQRAETGADQVGLKRQL